MALTPNPELQALLDRYEKARKAAVREQELYDTVCEEANEAMTEVYNKVERQHSDLIDAIDTLEEVCTSFEQMLPASCHRDIAARTDLILAREGRLNLDLDSAAELLEARTTPTPEVPDQPEFDSRAGCREARWLDLEKIIPVLCAVELAVQELDGGGDSTEALRSDAASTVPTPGAASPASEQFDRLEVQMAELLLRLGKLELMLLPVSEVCRNLGHRMGLSSQI